MLQILLLLLLAPAADARLERGLQQVKRLWRASDGDAATLAAFVREHYVPDEARRTEMFQRYERILEALLGHFHEMRRELNLQTDLDLGPIRPYDELFSRWSPSAHLVEDLFASKIAFAALLNFPLTTLGERLRDGPRWTRRQWAEARLAQRFSRRVPAEVEQGIARAMTIADTYISSYNLHLHHVLDERGERLFPPGLRLITHWGLRDEIRGRYADKQGLPRQRLIARVMERIVRGDIPDVVVDEPRVDWTPSENRVVPARLAPGEVAPAGKPAPTAAAIAAAAPEGDRRYEQLLGIFRAQRRADPYSPLLPTHIQRSFEEGREIPEAEVRKLLEAVLGSPLVPKVARLVERRLGRKLEPFDIWYTGFRPRAAHDEAELDRIVKQRYPDVAAFQADLPRILGALGFDRPTVAFLSERIVVDPSRGAGHASGAERRGDKARLRTRIPAGGMNYKGYNIAIHELGHNVEQVFSLDRMDHYLLHGVPNTAFTEALAFVFQSRDLELLGLGKPGPDHQHLHALNDFWATYEIAGVAMVDIAVWHWMYDHPDATAGQLRQATIAIAKDIWNRWYAPVFGVRDSVLLGIYSHMIDAGLYLPDYPLGHLIAFQLEEHLSGKSLAREMERMCRQGMITPDAWMRGAVGAPISAEPLLRAAERALAAMAR